MTIAWLGMRAADAEPGGMPRSLLAMSLALLTVAGSASASAEAVLYTDPVSDGYVTGPAWAPVADLIEGRIVETDTELIIVWEVAANPFGTLALPAGLRLDFEFTLDVPDDAVPPEDFGVRLESTRTGATIGYIDGSCTEAPEGQPVSCTRLSSAHVTTSVEGPAFSARLRRSDLKAGGASVAVDGAVLMEKHMYRGIAAYLGANGAVVTHNLSDQASMTAAYRLGPA